MALDTVQIVYNNLREEIVKRVELEHQIIYFTLLIFGAVLAVGLKSANTTIFLLYPVLIMFLAATWVDNQIRIGEISAYIKEKITPMLGEDVVGWELALQNRFHAGFFGFRHILLTSIGKRALFFGSQAIVIILIFPMATQKSDSTTSIFFWIAVISTFITFTLLALFQPPVKMPPEKPPI